MHPDRIRGRQHR